MAGMLPLGTRIEGKGIAEGAGWLLCLLLQMKTILVKFSVIFQQSQDRAVASNKTYHANKYYQ